jgi:hypothetical protein
MIIEEVKVGQKWSNVTRPQIVEVIFTNVNKYGVKLVTYNVIKPTSYNPLTEFTVPEYRFLNIYEK